MSPIVTFVNEHAKDLVAIVGVYLLGQLVLYGIVRKFADQAGENSPGGRRHKRARTVAKLIYGIGHAVLLLISLFWILRIIDVDPTPILASAGIVGVALGFGAQTLVKDFLSGLFILAENQYGIGDHVMINDKEGVVKQLSFRSTVLENADGHKIYIPNGTISTVVNMGERN